MATEMVRVQAMSDEDRELVNILSVEERLAALRGAGRRKVAEMHAQHSIKVGNRVQVLDQWDVWQDGTITGTWKEDNERGWWVKTDGGESIQVARSCADFALRPLSE